MRKIVTAAIAGALVVGAAFTATAIGGGPAEAQEEDDTAATGEWVRPQWHPGKLLEEVLDGLVADGTLTEAQATAVIDAVEAKAAEVREEHPLARHPFRLGLRLGALLDDGVITAEELAELPDGHPLADPDGPAAEYLDDGEITADEFRQLMQELRAERRAN